jgi:hypothetical protein
MRVRPVASNQAHSSTRRIRRHDQRVAALAVTGVLVAGLGVGIGLGGDGGAPTVDQPPPTVTGPGPTVPSTAVTRPAAAPGERPTTFTGDLGGRVAVRSTRTGKVVRTLFWPHPFATRSYAVGMSPDPRRSTSATRAPIPVRSRGSSGSRPAAASRSGSWAARTPRA